MDTGKSKGWQQKLSVIVLWFYLWILFWLQAISIDVDVDLFFWFFLGILGFASAVFLMRFLPDKLCDVKMKNHSENSRFVGAAVAAITFCIFEIYHAGQYPGGLSADTVTQYYQAIGEAPYNDWHPVLHPILFFTLPLKTGRQLGFIVFMQLLYFSLALGYLAYVLHKNGCPRLFFLAICVYIWVNPFMATYMMYPWKDIAMTVFATLLMGYYIQIICSEGHWLDKKRNLFVFTASAVLCGFMRHNAVLFVGPLILLVMIYAVKSKKIRCMFIFFIVLFFLLVKGLYVVLKVEQPDKRTVETVGLPATIWCNVMQKNPDALPEETSDFMYELASREAYENNYVVGSFNAIKFSGAIDTIKIDSLSYGEVLKYTWQCFRYAPKESLQALAKLTDMVWAVDGKDGPKNVLVGDNSWGIVQNPYPKAAKLVYQFKNFFTSGFGKILFGSFGLELLVLLIISAGMFAKRRCSFIHILPLFCYDFGTMLLLSGRDYRFFLFNIPLWLPVLFLMFRDNRGMKSDTHPAENKRNEVSA